MRKTLPVILSASILFFATSSYSQTQSQTQSQSQIHTQSNLHKLHHPPIPQESPNTEKVAIVMLEKQQSPQEILAKHPELELRYVFEHALLGFSVKGPASALDRLTKQENILRVSPVNTYQVETDVPPFNTKMSVAETGAPPFITKTNRLATANSFSNTNKNQTLPKPNDENIKMIGGDEVRSFYDPNNQRLTGKGVTVGVIDTGIDYTHPDLKTNYKGGHDLVDNDKDPMESKGNNGPATLHGTHVAGIIAANGKIRGVAPEATLIAYRALGPGGSGTTEQVIAAIEQAIKDKVDIVNLSLGNSVNGPDLPISLALNRAVDTGITAVTSSGNSGPNRWTVGSPGTASKAISVGASTPPQKIPYLQITGNQKIRMEPMQGAPDWTIDIGSQELAIAGLGSRDELAAANVKGKIVLLDRGRFTFTQKAINALKAGAKAVIIANNSQGSFSGNLEEMVPIPVSAISKADGVAIKNSATKIARTILIEERDILADFSSRGPVTVTWEIKPDVVAPGVAINSTIPGGYLSLQGTSMAAPHVAGACALIKQAHPNWGPQEIKAALMNTAKPIANQTGQPYKTYEQGAGRIQPVNALQAESLVVPGSLQFGKFQLADNKHQHKAYVTVKNIGDTEKSYYFSLPKNEPGIEWQFPLSFRLKPDEEKRVAVRMTIKPSFFSKKIYDGRLEINEGDHKIRVPYLYVFEEPDYPRVMGFEFKQGDKEKTYRYEVYLPGGADEFGIALFNPSNYQFVGFLDWRRNVPKGTIEKEIWQEKLPVEGLYLVKVFARKGGKEDILESMIEVPGKEGD